MDTGREVPQGHRVCGREAHPLGLKPQDEGEWDKCWLWVPPCLAELPLLRWVWSTRLNFLLLWLFWLVSHLISHSLASPVRVFTAQKVSQFASVCSTAGPGDKTECVCSTACIQLMHKILSTICSVLFPRGATARTARSAWVSGGETPERNAAPGLATSLERDPCFQHPPALFTPTFVSSSVPLFSTHLTQCP